MKSSLLASVVVIVLAAPPLAAQGLESVQVHVGTADLQALVSGDRSLPLSEPTVAIDPAFDEDVTSYTVRMPFGVDAATLVVEASFMIEEDNFGIVDFNGADSGFTGLTYERFPANGKVIPLSLQPGDNHLRLGAGNAFGSTVYEFVITRPDAPSGDTTLASLEIDGGELNPPFDRNARMYRTRVVGNRLTVTPTPSSGTVTVRGAAADGKALDVDGDTVSGLTGGENTIEILVQAEDTTRESYTLTVEASNDVRKVASGDKISRPGDCDATNGCDGTLNGVNGRFACVGDDINSESENFRLDVSGLCVLSLTEEGAVDLALGWFFASFPSSPR